jgi:hypothetical protein
MKDMSKIWGRRNEVIQKELEKERIIKIIKSRTDINQFNI